MRLLVTTRSLDGEPQIRTVSNEHSACDASNQISDQKNADNLRIHIQIFSGLHEPSAHASSIHLFGRMLRCIVRIGMASVACALRINGNLHDSRDIPTIQK